MIRLSFTQEAIDQLFHERYEHPHPLIQRKMEALYLKSQGLQNSHIANLLRITRRTLQKWLNIYEKEGIEGLKKLHYKGQRSKLHEHSKTIEEYFRENPPRSIQEACLTIEKITGIKRGETPVRQFLKSLGMTLRKTGLVPGKANPTAQEEFKKKRSNQYWQVLEKEKKKFSL
jgi:transposase